MWLANPRAEGGDDSTAGGCHDARIVPDEHNLTTSGKNICVFHATQFRSTKTCAVDDYVCFLAAGVEGGGLVDMTHNAPTDGGAVLQGLGCEPWKIYGGVHADGGEGSSGVDARRKIGLGEEFEVGDDVFVPGVGTKQLALPNTDCAGNIFCSVPEDIIWSCEIMNEQEKSR